MGLRWTREQLKKETQVGMIEVTGASEEESLDVKGLRENSGKMTEAFR